MEETKKERKTRLKRIDASPETEEVQEKKEAEQGTPPPEEEHLVKKTRIPLPGKILIILGLASANLAIVVVAGILSFPLLFPSRMEKAGEEGVERKREETPQKEEDPKSLDLLGCAQRAYQREEWPSVLVLYERTLESGLAAHPQDRISAFLKMGEASLKLGDQKRAFEYFKNASGEMEQATRFGSLLEGAERYFKNGDFSSARRLYYSFLARSGELPSEKRDLLVQAYLHLAETYRKEYERAFPQKDVEDDIPWEDR